MERQHPIFPPTTSAASTRVPHTQPTTVGIQSYFPQTTGVVTPSVPVAQRGPSFLVPDYKAPTPITSYVMPALLNPRFDRTNENRSNLSTTIKGTSTPPANDENKACNQRLTDIVIPTLNQLAAEKEVQIPRWVIQLTGWINQPDAKGYTALMYAAYYGVLPVIDPLIKAGATPMWEIGTTSLHAALNDKKKHTGATPYTVLEKILVTLHQTAPESVEYIINKSSFDAKDKKHKTVLHATLDGTIKNRQDIQALVRLLLHFGANPLTQNSDGKSAIDMACMLGNLDKTSILRDLINAVPTERLDTIKESRQKFTFKQVSLIQDIINERKALPLTPFISQPTPAFVPMPLPRQLSPLPTPGIQQQPLPSTQWPVLTIPDKPVASIQSPIPGSYAIPGTPSTSVPSQGEAEPLVQRPSCSTEEDNGSMTAVSPAAVFGTLEIKSKGDAAMQSQPEIMPCRQVQEASEFDPDMFIFHSDQKPPQPIDSPMLSTMSGAQPLSTSPLSFSTTADVFTTEPAASVSSVSTQDPSFITQFMSGDILGQGWMPVAPSLPSTMRGTISQPTHTLSKAPERGTEAELSLPTGISSAPTLPVITASQIQHYQQSSIRLGLKRSLAEKEKKKEQKQPSPPSSPQPSILIPDFMGLDYEEGTQSSESKESKAETASPEPKKRRISKKPKSTIKRST